MATPATGSASDVPTGGKCHGQIDPQADVHLMASRTDGRSLMVLCNRGAVGEGAQVVAALHAFLAEAGDKDALPANIGRQ